MPATTEQTGQPGTVCSQDVEHALHASDWSTIRSLRAVVHGDVVTLTGYVGSYYEKQMARIVVLNITGIREVRDQIEVFYH